MKYRNVSNGVIAAGSTPVMAAAIHDDISGGASEFILDFGFWIEEPAVVALLFNPKSKIQNRRLTPRLWSSCIE